MALNVACDGHICCASSNRQSPQPVHTTAALAANDDDDFILCDFWFKNCHYPWSQWARTLCPTCQNKEPHAGPTRMWGSRDEDYATVSPAAASDASDACPSPCGGHRAPPSMNDSMADLTAAETMEDESLRISGGGDASLTASVSELVIPPPVASVDGGLRAALLVLPSTRPLATVTTTATPTRPRLMAFLPEASTSRDVEEVAELGTPDSDVAPAVVTVAGGRRVRFSHDPYAFNPFVVPPSVKATTMDVVATLPQQATPSRSVPLRRTVMCCYFKQGRVCKMGEDCWYGHEGDHTTPCHYGGLCKAGHRHLARAGETAAILLRPRHPMSERTVARRSAGYPARHVGYQTVDVSAF